ncbi:hypothetical protein GCM10008025_05970 [Ornithinibacillus halotolerans]|uniref:CAAX prenyl protease 2/Lysostaphin resistance protein A-like domain-containing protein n=1 Tax=Ornithinibacillus halotolerans TaxID=1274357 RepID=A0A916RS32_9BACI|nr:hypothetical protein GCM10008025_05970 [Ornithinibacillus halotolerans]
MLLTMLATLFFVGIISISYQQVVFSIFVFIGLLIFLFVNKEKRFVISLPLAFLTGFVLFMVANDFVETMNVSKEIEVILNRLFLVFIIIGIALNHHFFNKKVYWYNEKPNWKNPIVLPFHKINTFWFWLIGIVVNVIIYMSFIVQKDVEYLQQLLLFCIAFSLINAVFEEVIWRGILLSALKEHTSTGYAVITTSVGFGLLHLVIGFSISLSLLISVAGVIYALITLKTNSIYPSIIFHIVINIGMVYSGFII